MLSDLFEVTEVGADAHTLGDKCKELSTVFCFEITISILHVGLYRECCAESCHIWQVIYCVTRTTDLGLWCSS